MPIRFCPVQLKNGIDVGGSTIAYGAREAITLVSDALAESTLAAVNLRECSENRARPG
jgi:hypothetical protein